MSTALDPKQIHRAHVVSLTSMLGRDAAVTPTAAAQCTGRIGWDYRIWTHPFIELYRGIDWDEAQRICDEHNAEHHPNSKES